DGTVFPRELAERGDDADPDRSGRSGAAWSGSGRRRERGLRRTDRSLRARDPGTRALPATTCRVRRGAVPSRDRAPAWHAGHVGATPPCIVDLLKDLLA